MSLIKTTTEFQNLVRRAEDGDFDAQCYLAELYRCGGHVVLRNYVEAEKWYLSGAEQGRRDAQLGLALLYLRGLGKRVEGMRLLALSIGVPSFPRARRGAPRGIAEVM
jgi:TPR repeat protein